MQAILLYWFAAQQLTSTFSRKNLGLLYLMQNLMQNLMSGVLISKKTTGSTQKGRKTKIVQKNAYMRISR